MLDATLHLHVLLVHPALPVPTAVQINRTIPAASHYAGEEIIMNPCFTQCQDWGPLQKAAHLAVGGTCSITSRPNSGNCDRGLKQQRQKGSVSFAPLSSEKPNPYRDAGGCLWLLGPGGAQTGADRGLLTSPCPSQAPSEQCKLMPVAISSAADSKVLIKVFNLGLMVSVSLGTQRMERGRHAAGVTFPMGCLHPT